MHICHCKLSVHDMSACTSARVRDSYGLHAMTFREEAVELQAYKEGIAEPVRTGVLCFVRPTICAHKCNTYFRQPPGSCILVIQQGG